MLKTILKLVLDFLGTLFNRNKIAKWETKQREDVSKAERDIRDAVDKVGPPKDVDIKDRPDDDAFNNKNWNN